MTTATKQKIDTKWKFNHLSRWKITATLQTLSPLHIGNGDVREMKVTDSKGQKEQAIQANAIIRGKDGIPIIPGSTIKGKLSHYLNNAINDKTLKEELKKVLGEGYISETEQGKGGLAEFHDAFLSEEITPKYLPEWNQEKQTYIEASTAIDRHTRTALDASLHYTEYVPKGVKFQLVITGDMNEVQAALLVHALSSKDTHILQLGANNSNGMGRVELWQDLQIECLNKESIFNWLEKNSTDKRSTECFRQLNNEEVKAFAKDITSKFNLPNNKVNEYKLTLQFNGPFIINDPSQKTGADQEAAHQLLRNNEENPALPASSVRGALRSQAERIIRTMGGQCCDTEAPCNDFDKLCITCQMFGATGWKTTVNLSHFKYEGDGGSETQQFVAIDRFHGGGKDTALFNTEYTIRPKYTGILSLDIREQNKEELKWRKGLLALLFRDLKEGDITFGMGRNKGYGKIETVKILPDSIDNENIQALRNRITENPALGESSGTPEKTKSHDSQTINPQSKTNNFHNPYHFIPVKEPVTSHWLDKNKLQDKEQKKNQVHSHAIYRSKTDKGEAVYHGKITCTLTAETPFFVGQGKQDNQPENNAQEQKLYCFNGEPAIPATSLRGMISSLTEAASNSAMRVLDENGLLSYRKDANNALKKIGLIYQDSHENWKISRLISNVANAITLKKVYGNQRNSEMADFINECQSWSPQHNVVYYLPEDKKGSIPRTSYRVGMLCGILRILGNDAGREKELENKKNEIFIPIDKEYIDTKNNSFKYENFIQKNNGTPLTKEVIDQYTNLANQRSMTQKNDKELDKDGISSKWLPFHLKGQKHNRDESLKTCTLPIKMYDLVYYADMNTQITELSFSAIWRGKIKNSTQSFFPPELLPLNKNRKKISPAELLFGFVELNEENKERDHALAYTGKVRIGMGTLTKEYEKQGENLFDDRVTLKALSSPKLPSSALYFKNNKGNNYIPKAKLNNNQHQAQGRKTYLHALRKQNNPNEVQKLTPEGKVATGKNTDYPWVSKPPKDDKRDNLRVSICPIKKGVSFTFDVDFDNLTKWELGLLCYSLTPSETHRHKLGMGKPIGLGTVNIEPQSIQTIDREKRYKQDDQGNPRYNGESWEKSDKTKWLNELKQHFIKTMDTDIQRAIELLGNPQNIKNPVHYPQLSAINLENENFKWFVENDGTHKKHLEAITEESINIPALERYQEDDKKRKNTKR